MSNSLFNDALIHAHQARDNGDWPTAYHAYSTLLQQYPQHPELLIQQQTVLWLHQATEAYQQQDFQAALQACQEAIHTQPSLFRSYNLLGNIFLAIADYSQAVQAFTNTTQLNPQFANAFCNLGSALLALQQIEPAITALQHAVHLNPQFNYALELLAQAYELNQNFDQALIYYHQILSQQPENIDLLNKCAELATTLQQYTQAINYYQKILALQPDILENHLKLSILLQQDNQLNQAITLCKKILETSPKNTQALYILANCHSQQDHFDQSNIILKQILDIDPQFTPAILKIAYNAIEQNNTTLALNTFHQLINTDPNNSQYLSGYAFTLQEQGNYIAANDYYKKAIKIDSNNSEINNNYASCLQEMGKYEESIEYCYKSLKIHKNPDAFHNLGTAFAVQGDHTKAILNYYQALDLSPNKIITYNNLGTSLLIQAKVDEARLCFEKVILLNPYNDEAWSNLLFTLCLDKETSPYQYLEKARKYASYFESNKHYSEILTNNTTEKIRVGFVSGDFKQHPVGFFLESILDYLIKNNDISYIAYNNTPPNHHDNLTKKLKQKFDIWHNISHLTDQELTDLIRNDKINLLIDLSGHTAGNRLKVFTKRPAPVQISWLGYFASTGLSSLDYFITDPIASSDNTQSHFSEKLWYLPHTRLCFTAPHHHHDISNTPYYKNSYITFGCFQRINKINFYIIHIWSHILNATPNSKLLIKGKGLDSAATQDYLYQQFANCNIEPSRIILAEESYRDDYLETYNQVDFMLDTFPFPGGTTTCEALWMGVPTLTLAGETLLQRQGASLLTAAGLPNWIAYSEQEYIDKAIAFAQQPDYLNQLRQTLRTQVEQSPLMDAQQFAKNLEQAFLEMWQIYCNTSHKT